MLLQGHKDHVLQSHKDQPHIDLFLSMSAYVGDKLISTWEDDHEANITYLHQCVTLFWNCYMYFQYFVIMVLQIHASGTTKVYISKGCVAQD
jgi:hypothetical protein